MDTDLAHGLEDLARREGLRLLVLFGSTARTARLDEVTEQPPEDLDIAVDAGGVVDALHLTNLIARELGRGDVDLIDLRRADPVLLMAVAEEGIPVFQEDPLAFRRFQSLAARRFFDTKKFRDARTSRDRGLPRADRGRRMTELDRALIRRKLTRIVRSLDDLAEVEGIGLNDFRSDRFRQKGTEKLLQELVEAAVDAILHMLRVGGEATPADYFGSFVEVGRAGIIPTELAEALAPSTGLRNRLVHDYDEIDDTVVLQAVGEALRLYPRYVAAVESYLEQGA